MALLQGAVNGTPCNIVPDTGANVSIVQGNLVFASQLLDEFEGKEYMQRVAVANKELVNECVLFAVPLAECQARQLFLGAVSAEAGHSGDTPDSQTVVAGPTATTTPGMAALTGSHGEQQILAVTRAAAKKFGAAKAEREKEALEQAVLSAMPEQVSAAVDISGSANEGFPAESCEQHRSSQPTAGGWAASGVCLPTAVGSSRSGSGQPPVGGATACKTVPPTAGGVASHGDTLPTVGGKVRVSDLPTAGGGGGGAHSSTSIPTAEGVAGSNSSSSLSPSVGEAAVSSGRVPPGVGGAARSVSGELPDVRGRATECGSVSPTARGEKSEPGFSQTRGKPGKRKSRRSGQQKDVPVSGRVEECHGGVALPATPTETSMPDGTDSVSASAGGENLELGCPGKAANEGEAREKLKQKQGLDPSLKECVKLADEGLRAVRLCKDAWGDG